MGNKILKSLAADGAFSRDVGLLILRLGFGLTMLLAHGWPKLLAFSERKGSFPDPLGVGSFASLSLVIGAEVGCAILICVGLLTRLAAVPLAFTMVVAVFVINAQEAFAKQELGLVYLFSYVALIATGAGRFSLDRKVFR